MLLRDTYQRRDYRKLIARLRSGDRILTDAHLLEEAADAIEELEDEVADWKAYGKWERTGRFCECDQCLVLTEEETRFCPNCGAMMKGEE